LAVAPVIASYEPAGMRATSCLTPIFPQSAGEASLAGAGGLNDALAFPFVMSGLGLLGANDMGPGAVLGWGVDRRSGHDEVVEWDEFLGLGVVRPLACLVAIPGECLTLPKAR